MLRIIAILVVGAVVTAGAWWLALLPGTVSAEIGETTLEAPTPVVALGLVLLFVAFYLVVRLIGHILALPHHTRRWQGHRRRSGGDVAVTRTLLALAAGEGGDARREAARARKLLGDTPQTLLLAAEAGRLAGREDEAEAAFRALAARQDAPFIGLRGLLRQAIAREDWSEAAALARQAEAASPGAAWLRTERAQLAVRAGNWGEALALAGPDAPKATLGAAAAEAEPDPAKALRLAKQAWTADPALVPAALSYARRLRQAGKEGRAQDVVRTSWTANPHPDLAEFALAATPEPLARVQAAARLAKANPGHPESLLAQARAELDAGLTGEARRHAEAAREAGLNQRRLWLLLADIEHAEPHDDGTAGRDALRHAATADPDPTWVCQDCGTTYPAWRPTCTVCGHTGTIGWAPAGKARVPV
jgi:HemY protein